MCLDIVSIPSGHNISNNEDKKGIHSFLPEIKPEKFQQITQDKEESARLFQQKAENISQSADKIVDECEEIFKELICLMQKIRYDVKQQVRSQQETKISRVKEIQKHLEQVSNKEDLIQFLHNYPCLSTTSQSTQFSSIEILPPFFEDVTAIVIKFRDNLKKLLKDTWPNISLEILQSELETRKRDEFLKYSQKITLDPDTAHARLLLLEGNRKVTLVSEPRSHSSHQERFTDFYQVLSRESLTGRCYWVVEWSRRAYVAVVYKDICRAGSGTECGFGCNDKSWALDCSPNGCRFGHNNIWTLIPGPVSSRIGVYLDHSAGVLSFYGVSETMTLLHRVQTTFTQPLHAGVCVGDSVEFCKPE
ncbi:PREDICTED: tripartite motif-containing protein 16-like [Cyprinodon variegatus]|uniref:tripartite motif-containing protein 16-like n=1 Tax=Cyprinodon variegatus TaxID=28743 RepID=UPI0007428C4D|nr:PREDICTED: tripartite motif-containing protein 16-like [Cyprinodon variegatus]